MTRSGLSVSDGDRIMIFDSGGGTTDLMSADLSVKNGERIGLQSLQFDSAERVSGQPFGGTNITDSLALWMANDEKRPPERRFELLARANELDYADDPDSRWSSFDDRASAVDEEGVPTDPWTFKPPVMWQLRFPQLWHKIDHSKVQVYEESARQVELFAAVGGLPSLYLQAATVDSMIEKLLPDLLSQVERTAALDVKVSRPLSSVFVVGGNSEPEVVHRTLQRCLARVSPTTKVIVPQGMDLKEIVPRGTVLVLEETGFDLPYDLVIEAFGPDGKRIGEPRLFASNSIGTRTPVRFPFKEVAKGQVVRFRVKAKLGDECGVVATYDAANDSPSAASMDVRFSIEKQALHVQKTVGFMASHSEMIYDI